MLAVRRGSLLLIPASFYTRSMFDEGISTDTLVAAHNATDPGKAMFTQRYFEQRLRATFPTLALRRAEVLIAGQNNHIVRINDELIFRFPRFPATTQQLRVEVTLLDALGPRLTTPIPRPIYRGLSPPPGNLPFVGYRALPGDTLEVDQIATLATSARMRLAEDVGRFLRELHSIAPGSLGTILLTHGDPHAAWWDEWRRLHTRLRTSVFPRVPEDVRARIDATFAAPFATADPSIALTFIHGDFGPGNWLGDGANGALAGVLVCGEAFTHLVLATYPALATALPRARRYRATFAAQEALYGVEHDDEGAFGRGIAPYRAGPADA